VQLPPEPSRPLNDFTDPQQERIYHKIQNRISEGVAVSYRDACRLRNNPLLFESTTHLVAHLLRDMESAIRNMALPDSYQRPLNSPTCPICKTPLTDKCPKCGSMLEKEVQKKEIEAIARAYQLDRKAEEQWKRLASKFHGYAHRDSLEPPRQYTQSMQNFFDDVDGLLDELLLILDAQHSKAIAMIDALLESKNPIDVKARMLRQKMPNTLNYHRYLFQKLDEFEWLDHLKKNKFFDRPPTPIYDDEIGRYRLSEWPASGFLARMAQKAQKAGVQKNILIIALEIPETENPYVRQDIIDIALALPPDMSVQLLPKIQSWLRRL